MSKYTTELRFICENYARLSESQGGNKVNEIINKALPKIFDFDYPIFDENYRSELEKKIIRHYYTREICCETVGRWKLFLEDKLNIIMPYYNQLYNSALLEIKPLITTDITTNRTINRNNTNNVTSNLTGTTDVTNISDSTGNVTTSSNGNSSSTVKESDTPQGGISGLVNDNYLTNASINNATDSVSSTVGTTDKRVDDNSESRKENKTESRTGTEGENYVEKITGFSGANQSEMLLKFRETFLNIDNMVIEELNELFFSLW